MVKVLSCVHLTFMNSAICPGGKGEIRNNVDNNSTILFKSIYIQVYYRSGCSGALSWAWYQEVLGEDLLKEHSSEGLILSLVPLASQVFLA